MRTVDEAYEQFQEHMRKGPKGAQDKLNAADVRFEIAFRIGYHACKLDLTNAKLEMLSSNKEEQHKIYELIDKLDGPIK